MKRIPLLQRSVYSFVIRFYFTIILIASLFNKKARKWVVGRAGVWQRLRRFSVNLDRSKPIIWLHVASVGEFEQARPIIESIKTKFADAQILLTFFSPSGYELRKNYKEVDAVEYLPADTLFNAQKFIRIINPDLAVFVKYEYWPFYLEELSSKNIPLYMVSARFKPSSVFAKKHFDFITKPILKLVTHFFVQDAESGEMLQTKGFVNYILSGDTRFDRVFAIKSKNQGKFEFIKAKSREKQILVAGSTWQKDEALLLSLKEPTKQSFIFCIVPHEINSTHIAQLKSKWNAVLLSEILLNNEKYAGENIVVDSIGNLSELYAIADIAYVGGGFGKGIHNILEAVVYGLAVITGPNFKSFREARELNKLQVHFGIKNEKELEAILTKVLSEANTKAIWKDKAEKYIQENTGATEETMLLLAPKIAKCYTKRL